MTDIVTEYYNWLKDKTFMNVRNNVSRISLPFLNPDNDFTEIFIISEDNNHFRLTDDGETINQLEMSGLTFSGRRKEILMSTLKSFGVSMDNKALNVCADGENLMFRKHMFIQCLLKIQDMYYLRNENVKSLFFDDVMQFLNQNNIRYTENLSIVGKSKLPCHFDFVIPHSQQAPERLIRTINRLDNQAAKLLIFNWEDTKVMRKPDSKLYAFINSTDADSKQSALESMIQYSIAPVNWKDRNSVIQELSA